MSANGVHVQAFTIDGERGNSALVFATRDNERVNVKACIATAARLRSEVTWVRKKTNDSPTGLRFFTRGGEIAFCGHGVLAATAWLDRQCGNAVSHDFNIGGEMIRVERDRMGRWSYLQSVGGSKPVGLPLLEEALLALGLTHIGSLREAGANLARSVGAPREKLLLELPDAMSLGQVTLDAARRDALCERLETTGIYAYSVCRGRLPRLVARHFPLRCGLQEDMATGGIAPTIARHAGFQATATEVVIDQGGPYCHNARLFVSTVESDAVCRISGECVIGADVPFAGIVSESY